MNNSIRLVIEAFLTVVLFAGTVIFTPAGAQTEEDLLAREIDGIAVRKNAIPPSPRQADKGYRLAKIIVTRTYGDSLVKDGARLVEPGTRDYDSGRRSFAFGWDCSTESFGDSVNYKTEGEVTLGDVPLSLGEYQESAAIPVSMSGSWTHSGYSLPVEMREMALCGKLWGPEEEGKCGTHSVKGKMSYTFDTGRPEYLHLAGGHPHTCSANAGIRDCNSYAGNMFITLVYNPVGDTQ